MAMPAKCPLILDCRALPPTMRAHDNALHTYVVGAHRCPTVLLVGEMFALELQVLQEALHGPLLDPRDLRFRNLPVITELPEPGA